MSAQDPEQDSEQRPRAAGVSFPAGVDDLVIMPLAAMAFAVWRVLRRAFFILVDLVDFLFPILLQVMRFPLFTLRIVGDAIAALLKAIVRILPVGSARRAAWREFVSEHWTWLRQKISYKAFEEWLHHTFEVGMAWVFRTCRALTPQGALLVILGAILWLPISFGVATVMHAVLIAKAMSLPAWTQLLHPVATVIAKSKLLVLPVYPAAWPQAKQHPAMQALIRFWGALIDHYVMRKLGYRYRQTEDAAAAAGDALRHTAAATGLSRLGAAMLAGVNVVVAAIGNATRHVISGLIDVLSKAPLLGAVIQRYDAHYDAANDKPAVKFSERMRDLYARWSVKFTAEYYHAKEQQNGAKDAAGA